MQDVVLFAEVLNGTEEALGERDESGKNADGNGIAHWRERSVQHGVAAEPNDGSDSAGRQDFYHRIVDGVRHDGVFEGIHVGGIDLFELLVGALLAVKKLQHHDAADMLLQISVNAGNGYADAAVAVAHGAAEKRSSHEDQWQSGEGDQRQPPLKVQHQKHDAGQHENIFDDGNHSGGKQLVERVHVGGDAGDQPPDRIAVEEGDVHLLQVAEDLAAQVEHYLLAGPLHVIGLGKFQKEAEAEQEDVNRADLGDAAQRLRTQPSSQQGLKAKPLAQYEVDSTLRRQVLVHRHDDEQRPGNIGGGFKHNGAQRECYLPFVGTQIGEQPPHQTAVIRFSQGFFLGVPKHPLRSGIPVEHAVLRIQ